MEIQKEKSINKIRGTIQLCVICELREDVVDFKVMRELNSIVDLL